MPLSSERIQAICQLDEESSPGLLRELLLMAQKTFPKQVEQIGAALRNEEFDSLHFEAHSFYSSAASLGADQLAARASELEKWAKKPNENLPMDTYRQLEEECSLAMREFERLLEQNPAKGL